MLVRFGNYYYMFIMGFIINFVITYFREPLNLLDLCRVVRGRVENVGLCDVV